MSRRNSYDAFPYLHKTASHIKTYNTAYEVYPKQGCTAWTSCISGCFGYKPRQKAREEGTTSDIIDLTSEANDDNNLPPPRTSSSTEQVHKPDYNLLMTKFQDGRNKTELLRPERPVPGISNEKAETIAEMSQDAYLNVNSGLHESLVIESILYVDIMSKVDKNLLD